MLIKSLQIPKYTCSLLVHWCIWSTLDQIYVLLWTTWASSWWSRGRCCIGSQQGACAQILAGHSRAWVEVSWRRWSEAAGLFRFRLGREWYRSEKQIRVLFQLGISSDLLVQQEADFSRTQLSRGWVHAASLASCEAICLRKLLTGLFYQELEPTVIHCYNQSCIKLSENPVFHDRSKHIEIWYHFIRDRVLKGAVKLQYIPTDEQVVDILTKPLVKDYLYEYSKNTFESTS